MRITRIPTPKAVYSSNVYLIRGDFNAIPDVNTLVDAGADVSIVDEIRQIYTGAGKKAVEQVVITHNHFDHTGGIRALKDAFGTTVLGFSEDKIVDRRLKNDDVIKMGDRSFQVIHCPEHSQDSILLYGWEDHILFSGDSPIDIKGKGGTYSDGFEAILEKLASMRIDIIYPGHGEPLRHAREIITRSLEMVRGC